MKTVAILCAAPDSVYKTLPGVEVFDADRDAKTFPGGKAVVAHPPCRLWGTLRGFVKATEREREEEKQLGVWCANQIRRWGGVLEQPAHSKLWNAALLPKPGEKTDGNHFTLEIQQFWFGHRAAKFTWLYIAGLRAHQLPCIPLRPNGERMIPLENMSRRERNATPRPLALWLVEIARRCKPNKVTL